MTFNDATALAKPEVSSVPPLTVTAELADNVLTAPATSVPALIIVLPV